MSYIVVRVYSFECDGPGCDEISEDICPLPGPGLWGRVLRDLRSTGWTIRQGHHFCPEHSEAA